MLFDPDQIVPLIPAVAAQLLNVVYERVALTGGNPGDENNFRKEEAVVFRQWEDLMFRLNETTGKIREKRRT
jgi:hypothetical protein